MQTKLYFNYVINVLGLYKFTTQWVFFSIMTSFKSHLQTFARYHIMYQQESFALNVI